MGIKDTTNKTKNRVGKTTNQKDKSKREKENDGLSSIRQCYYSNAAMVVHSTSSVLASYNVHILPSSAQASDG